MPCSVEGNREVEPHEFSPVNARAVLVDAAVVGEDRVVADASWGSNGGSSLESLTTSEECASEFGLNVQLGLKMRLNVQLGSIQVLIRLLPSL